MTTQTADRDSDATEVRFPPIFEPILRKPLSFEPVMIAQRPDLPKEEWSDYERQAYKFLSWFTREHPQPLFEHPRLQEILSGIVYLIRSPKELDFGISRKDLFGMLQDIFESAHSCLWTLCQWGCPENSEHDECVKVWTSNVMARHYADIASQLETVRSVGEPDPGKPLGWFVRAMAGNLGAVGDQSFRAKYEQRRRELGSTGILEWFINSVFVASGYFLTSEDFNPPKGRPLTEEVRAALRRQGVSEADLASGRRYITREEHLEWERRKRLAVGSQLQRPRLTEDEFRMAWDCGGKTLRELKKLFREEEKKGFGDIAKFSPQMCGELRSRQLPLKWVASVSFPRLEAMYAEWGVKNPPEHLSKVESRLKEMARMRLVRAS